MNWNYIVCATAYVVTQIAMVVFSFALEESGDEQMLTRALLKTNGQKVGPFLLEKLDGDRLVGLPHTQAHTHIHTHIHTDRPVPLHELPQYYNPHPTFDTLSSHTDQHFPEAYLLRVCRRV